MLLCTLLLTLFNIIQYVLIVTSSTVCYNAVSKFIVHLYSVGAMIAVLKASTHKIFGTLLIFTLFSTIYLQTLGKMGIKARATSNLELSKSSMEKLENCILTLLSYREKCKESTEPSAFCMQTISFSRQRNDQNPSKRQHSHHCSLSYS